MKRFHPTKKSEAIALAFLAFCGWLLLLVAIFSVPSKLSKRPFNYGFGPGWSCDTQDSMEPTCVVK
jgi:hypothetical protein